MDTKQVHLGFIAFLICCSIPRLAQAEDWGAYALIPVSAPTMVLEVVGSSKDEGAIVSIAKPNDGANQKWIITPQADQFFSIRPSNGATRVLSVAKGGKPSVTIRRYADATHVNTVKLIFRTKGTIQWSSERYRTIVTAACRAPLLNSPQASIGLNRCSTLARKSGIVPLATGARSR